MKAYYAKRVKRHRTEVVVRTLMLAHAQELASAPGEQWPAIRAGHVKQIEAVRDGKLDIIDRRSYQWPYLPLSIGRTPQPVIKFSPANIRRFAKTPTARRAINLVKNSVLSLSWDVVLLDGGDPNPDQQQRIDASKYCLRHPNNTDTWQSFLEQGLDDYCTLGALVVEPQLTPDVNRPFKLWTVDSATIRIYPSWKESTPDKPRYAQMMGVLTANGAIPFLDCELMFLRDNPTVDSPFGLGKMEVAFEHVAALIGVQAMANRAGADSVHPTWFWWEQGNVQQNVEVIRRHLNNDLEGQSRIPLISGVPKPEVLDVQPVTDQDLLPGHQEMLIRMIATAFDLSPQALGLERDINRSTGEVMEDKDFRSCVVPVAVRVAEGITNFVLHRLLGWEDLAFKFNNLEDPDTGTKILQLSQLYQLNAIVPNKILAALGMPSLTTPYAELTQFEASLVLAQATAQLQQQTASKQMTQQSQIQQQMMEQQQEYQQQQPDEDDEGTASAATAGTAPKLGLVKLKPLAGLNKTPLPAMKGSRYSARQVAKMTKQQIKAAMKNGEITADVDQLTQQMSQQEGPGILLELAPDVISYLEQLKQQQQEELRQQKVKPSSQTIAKQKKRFRIAKKQQLSLDKEGTHPAE